MNTERFLCLLALAAISVASTSCSSRAEAQEQDSSTTSTAKLKTADTDPDQYLAGQFVAASMDAAATENVTVRQGSECGEGTFTDLYCLEIAGPFFLTDLEVNCEESVLGVGMWQRIKAEVAGVGAVEAYQRGTGGSPNVVTSQVVAGARLLARAGQSVRIGPTPKSSCTVRWAGFRPY